jgi:hypothetical protein
MEEASMIKVIRSALGVFVTGALLSLFSASGATVSPSSIIHAPRIGERPVKGSGWASSNWSGYAKTGTTYSSATAQWTVPAVSPSQKATYSSSWVGIDGFNNSNLIQTGTEQDFYQGAAHYNAWWEILPAAETPISTLTVHPGDRMTASITKGSGSSWTIAISDTSTGQSFSTVQTYTGPQSSVEWVQEAPSIGGHVATLAQFSQTTFDPGTANGKNPGLTANDGGVMIQKHLQVSTPSSPDRDTDGFTVSYGSTAPAPPSS